MWKRGISIDEIMTGVFLAKESKMTITPAKISNSLRSKNLGHSGFEAYSSNLF